ncbi:FtsB family cell division protein [Sphingomonas sp. Leaf21]|uniref:FtsB family cell division protein n=1 Tax=Sphingomonas sp. Leaf21 TaxID=2876550 RepID=UPI001E5B4F67|nr:septum formation initiator family protein [Sphingomonas sp. Leaf21]
MRTMRRAALPALGLTIVAFFGAYAVLGRNGLLAYGEYQRQLVKREQDYASLDRKRMILKNRVALLDPDHANPDMVDEMVRKELNVAHPDEVIVPLK